MAHAPIIAMFYLKKDWFIKKN